MIYQSARYSFQSEDTVAVQRQMLEIEVRFSDEMSLYPMGGFLAGESGEFPKWNNRSKNVGSSNIWRQRRVL
jgi:hypothetical protein